MITRWVALTAVAAISVACGPTTYPADVFPEMHYQPSVRRLEPERQSPPPEAVPVTGASPRMSFAAATTLTDPYPVSQPRLLSAREVARVNCSMCHGVAGRGDGPVAHYFSPVPPVDFLSDRVRGRTDGQLFWLIANGIGNMPAFRALLSEPELWDVVLFVRKSGDGE